MQALLRLTEPRSGFNSAQGSRRLLHHFAVLPDNHGQLVCAVLNPDVLRGAAESTFCASHEGWSFLMLGSLCPFCFIRQATFLTDSISCSDEIASRFTGRPRLSQIAQRVANGR